MSKLTDVAIIGAGQAGLAMSQCLSSAFIDHVVLERGRVGERWLSERWPSLRLLTPNWMTRLPGLPRAEHEPDGFMRASDFARMLSSWQAQAEIPVVCGAAVHSVTAAGARFRVSTSAGDWLARCVVIATGACDRPAIPAWAGNLPPRVRQIDPSCYRDPASLPVGGVLVVGASATGVQIANELAAAGRDVVLSTGRHARAPRRYRGRELFEWLDECGFLEERPGLHADLAKLRALPSLQLSGDAGGIELGLARLAAAGVRIAGRAIGAEGAIVAFDESLQSECLAAEDRRRTLMRIIDQHVLRNGLAVPQDTDAWREPPPLPRPPARLDLGAERIGSVIWATGYRRSYPWLHLPALEADGEIANHGGITPVDGLYVLGMPFMRRRTSAFIDGVGRDAAELAAHIARRFGAIGEVAA
ncbi:MAG: NAD(P)/FAD-dependent oxidoreductase [Nitratireductor sp.]|jgi:putative flavoprotein involved in K+ transport|nr:NAD(P)/FAD-dependent oxidoreductase [Nitratireductor sp.]